MEATLKAKLASSLDAVTSPGDAAVKRRALAEVLGFVYVVQCRGGDAGAVFNDTLSCHVLEEVFTSHYAVPTLQLVTPRGFRLDLSGSEIERLLSQLSPLIPTEATTVARLLKLLNECNQSPLSSQTKDTATFDDFLAGKSLSFYLHRSNHGGGYYPTSFTETGGGVRQAGVFVKGACDLVRIVNWAQFFLGGNGPGLAWVEELMRSPTNFTTLWPEPDAVLSDSALVEELAENLSPAYVFNLEQGLLNDDVSLPRDVCVLGCDGDVDKSLLRHKRTGLLVHIPERWGVPVRLLSADPARFGRWLREEWEPVPLIPVERIMEQLGDVIATLKTRKGCRIVYVINLNSTRPKHLLYDPSFQADPVENRHRLFNLQLQSLASDKGAIVIDFDIACKRYGVDSSKDIRHIRNEGYGVVGREFADDLRGRVFGTGQHAG